MSPHPPLHTLLLDSSVIVKWFINEVDSPLAQRLRTVWMEGQIELFYAELSLFEIANALYYSRLFVAQDVIVALEALQALGMTRLSMSPTALTHSVQLSYEYGIAIYDAYLVALALEHQLIFVSADRRLTHRLTAMPFVIDLNDFDPGFSSIG
jgi:predicted nucleic acid-binding protein